MVNRKSEEQAQIFAARLAGARFKASLDQEELAKKTGVSKRSIQAWESGSGIPRMQNLRTLAAVLCVPAPWLVGIDPDPNPLDEHERAYTNSPTPDWASRLVAELSMLPVSQRSRALGAMHAIMDALKADSQTPTVEQGTKGKRS
jgi:transcriptional regulator with XRE-family HTH domain